MNVWWKLAIIAAIFSAGMVTEYKFHLAGEVAGLKTQIEKAQKGQNNIIEFHQKIEKVYVKVKDDCLNANVPDDVQQLLK